MRIHPSSPLFLFICVIILCGTSLALQAAEADMQTASITVQVDKPGAAISPILNGVFFEDINFAADGGIYAERVMNRSFEFTDPLMGWTKVERGSASGRLAVLGMTPLNENNPRYLRLIVDNPGEGFGLANGGFRGIGLTKGAKYTFSTYARAVDDQPLTLHLELQGQNGQTLAEAELGGFSKEWRKHSCVLQSSATDPKARLIVLARSRGMVELDMISLFPQETWNNHPNGLRPDLVQLLKDLKPGFVRFPGGCIVEGRDLANRYQWKETIGDVAQRRLIINRWNTEFKHRPTPDYFQSFGLGFYEYFLLCEDIGAQPLPILNCGMACQFNTGQLVPLDQLEPYIQDALDLIEFANGPVTSTWGRKRAEMGHPAPFNLTLLGIGNEQWGPQYLERYERFARVLKTKHPEIKLISSSGPSPDGKDFDLAWNRLRELRAEIVDEHYYREPAWFPANVHRYDRYDRNGPKVFAGEFAAQSVATGSPKNRNNWNCALAEAAFMTGLERNADVVVMASYAPLFAHVEAWQWTPNLIWFDNLRSYGTPSYYVQKLFSVHRGATILPVKTDGSDRLFVCSSRDEQAGEIILKVVNTGAAARSARINLAGAQNVKPTGQIHLLASADLNAENTLDEPTRVAPVTRAIEGLGAEFQHEFPPQSLTVLRIGVNSSSR